MYEWYRGFKLVDRGSNACGVQIIDSNSNMVVEYATSMKAARVLIDQRVAAEEARSA